jgi:hypothetical protein
VKHSVRYVISSSPISTVDAWAWCSVQWEVGGSCSGWVKFHCCSVIEIRKQTRTNAGIEVGGFSVYDSSRMPPY